jgi:hypothetical protein
MQHPDQHKWTTKESQDRTIHWKKWLQVRTRKDIRVPASNAECKAERDGGGCWGYLPGTW